MKQLLRIISLCCFFLMACYHNSHSVQSKMNAELRERVHGQMKNIRFSGECRSEITPNIRQRIEKSGIQINMVKGPLFTGSGNSRQITNLAGLDIIIRLEAAPQYQYKPNEEITP